MMSSAAARSDGLLTFTHQSQALPSLCSLRPPIEQLRVIPALVVAE
jgi:hypothetical protein